MDTELNEMLKKILEDALELETLLKTKKPGGLYGNEDESGK